MLVYIDNLGTEPVCVQILGLKRNDVKELKKASVKVYDFHEKSERFCCLMNFS
jgi:hypothetical protein